MHTYSVNIARRDGETFNGTPRYVHFAKVELPNGLTEEQAREAFGEISCRFVGEISCRFGGLCGTGYLWHLTLSATPLKSYRTIAETKVSNT